jgi:hypothetical protein
MIQTKYRRYSIHHSQKSTYSTQPIPNTKHQNPQDIEILPLYNVNKLNNKEVEHIIHSTSKISVFSLLITIAKKVFFLTSKYIIRSSSKYKEYIVAKRTYKAGGTKRTSKVHLQN